MPNIYGNLTRAALELLSANPTAGITGRIYWNTTTTKMHIDDATNTYAMLRNDGVCVLGNNGTANNNIRLHRGAAAVLQFVQGGDATAEGSLSTSLAQISAKIEGYATGSLPSAGNAGRLLYDSTINFPKFDNGSAIKTLASIDGTQTLTNKTINTSDNTLKSGSATADQVLQADGAGNTSWATISGTLASPYDSLNYAIVTTVGSSALTIALKDKAGSDPSAGSPARFSFPTSAVAGTGTHVYRNVTGSLSTVVSSGSTLGHVSGKSEPLHLYVLDNAGTVELAYSSTRVDEGVPQSTTAEGGAGAADSRTVLYSTTARASVYVRYLCTIYSNQATAGTWASLPTVYVNNANTQKQHRSAIGLRAYTGYGSGNTFIMRFTTVDINLGGDDMTLAQSATDGDSVTINTPGLYFIKARGFTANGGGASGPGISKNASAGQMDANVLAITDLNVVLAGSYVDHRTANEEAVIEVSWQGLLIPGDVVRYHAASTAASGSGNSAFYICKVSD